MQNVFRTLIWDKQASLTLCDGSQIVQKAIEYHKLTPASALVLGKALLSFVFFSACLKEEKGEVSLSFQNDENGTQISVSGNQKLYMRGCIAGDGVSASVETVNENPQAVETLVLGESGAITVIRDDGYSRPFVGSCAYTGGGLDSGLETYFKISEQIPTRIATRVVLDANGNCVFAGVAALQLLPFASEETVKKAESEDLYALLQTARRLGAESAIAQAFSENDGVTSRTAVYKCNCSREYLGEVLISLGEAQMRQIIKEDGAVRVHCHYCNTDYEFTAEDADKLFNGRE